MAGRKKKRRLSSSSRPPAPAPGSGGEPERARMSPALKWTLTGVVALLAFGFSALFFVYPASHGPGGGRQVDLTLVGDESPDALAGKLAAAGIVAHPRLFAFYVRASGASGRVAKGVHLLTDDLSPRDVLTRVERRGAAPRARVVIPEGWTRFDVASRLESLHVCPRGVFLDATANHDLLAELRIDGASAEGYLFPATYDFPQDSLAEDVARRMKAEFDKRWAALEDKHASGMLDLTQSLGWGMREVVILASMIEKEAVVDDERPIIAAVFLNRLRDPAFKPKLLQCDPTAGYGCRADPTSAPSCATYTDKITHDVVADAANPYNTYKHEGLPPGPISNPGAKSIEAVMTPAVNRYLYFVAKGGGRHTFSETYGAHAAAVEESNKRQKAP